MIKEIEGFRAEVQTEALAKPEFLLQRGVDLVVPWPARRVAAQVAPGPWGGQRESRRVEPAVDGLIGGVERHALYQIGPLRTVVAIRKLVRAPLNGDIHRASSASCTQAGELPPAEESGEQAVPIQVLAPGSPGKLVNCVRCHGMSNVIGRA